MTLEQKIALKAMNLINSVRSENKDPSPNEIEYRSHTEGLPALIRSCGLSRTLAFLRARTEMQRLIASHIEIQLRNAGVLDANKDLQKQLAECSLAEYRLYARVALMIALWQKRVAQARLRRKEKET